jgi:hypothetical protein
MQTVRRLYLYGVALVSLETVLWGAIGLARSIFSGDVIGRDANTLAGALSLFLVGVPVFLLHWWLAQRQALKDAEEQSSRVRAVYLYGALLATLIPAVQNLLALLNRGILALLGAPVEGAILGGYQTVSDNLIAIVLNVLFAAYLYSVLRADWKAGPRGEAFPEVRRIYRYVWMLYGLVFLVFGVWQIVKFILTVWEAVGIGTRSTLANGLALTLLGAPLWVLAWLRIQNTLTDPDEARSLLRLVVLYVLAFAGVGSVLTSAGVALYHLLRVALGERMALAALLSEMSGPLSAALPFGCIWAYFGRVLDMEIRSISETGESYQQRAAGLTRLYRYVLALLGLVATFAALQALLDFILDQALNPGQVFGSGLRDNLAGGLAALVVGAPLWILTWRPLRTEAAREGEPGDHARRSLVRLAYLYIVLFVAVLGMMFSAGALLFPLLQALLGDAPPNLLSESLQLFKLLLLFALLFAYHGLALRRDRRTAERSLARRHAQFPVLVLAPEEGDFADQMAAALGREAAEMPVAVHPYSLGAPDESLSAARAVILPAELTAHPSEALRVWLQGYDGARLVVPTPASGWLWVFGSGRPLPALAAQTAHMVRALSEGLELPSPRESSPWMVLVYIIGGLVVLWLVSVGINLLVGGF